MEFNEIVLSGAELAALKALKKAHDDRRDIMVEPHNRSNFERLARLELAKVYNLVEPGLNKFPLPKAVHITNKGVDYLFYLKGKRADHRHELLLYIAGAVSGSAFTLIVEHFGDILRFFQNLLQ